MVLPELRSKSNRRMKLLLAISEYRSFAPVWITILVMDGGRESRMLGTFSSSLAVVKPGIQCTIALANLTRLTMESPITAVDGGHGANGAFNAMDLPFSASGGGGVDSPLTALGGGHGADTMERRWTATFKSLRRSVFWLDSASLDFP